jgi:hypothetical protein
MKLRPYCVTSLTFKRPPHRRAQGIGSVFREQNYFATLAASVQIFVTSREIHCRILPNNNVPGRGTCQSRSFKLGLNLQVTEQATPLGNSRFAANETELYRQAGT